MESYLIDQIPKGKSVSGQKGFSLVECLIAFFILTIGLLGVLAVIIYALGSVSDGQQLLVAKQKAREAMENIFSARDTGQVTFAQIQNQAPLQKSSWTGSPMDKRFPVAKAVEKSISRQPPVVVVRMGRARDASGPPPPPRI